MEKKCPSCEKWVKFETEEPKFCSHCGSSFSVSTQMVPPGDQSTLDAVTRPPSETGQPTGQLQYDSTDSADNVQIGSMIGPYEVKQQIGRGGMGVVFSAKHQTTGQKVAIKLLNQNPDDSPKAAERFHRESQIAASISNPRSTFVYASGEHQGRRFIVMELMPGGTLKELVKQQGRLPVGQAVDLILDVVVGIQSAHRRGIVHRDIKPSNCFVDHDGRIKIGDYGLSKSYDSDVQLTKTGTFMGTLQFAAPEQVKGAKVDERTDIYAIGATLYYLLTGEPPYDGDAAQVIAGIASDPVPNVRRKADQIPPKLARLVTQMLEKDPKNRPQTLTDIRNSLLPFATQGSTVADIGRRFAAFFVDFFVANFIVGVIATSIGAGILLFFNADAFTNEEIVGVNNLIAVTFGFLAQIVYFAVAEGIWGRGIGKLMFGMRVVDQRGSPPGLIRAFPRALLLPGAMLFGMLMLPVLITGRMNDPNQMGPMTAFIFQVGSTVAGWTLALAMLSTCRRANGFRGIHELATSTKVVRIGSSLSAPTLEDVPKTLPSPLQKEVRGELDDGVLEPIGLIGNTATGKVYLARDRRLDRQVWLAVDPAFVSSLTEERLHVNRPGRQRILEYEMPDDRRCVEAIVGTPIRDVIQQINVLQWQTIRLVLESLVDELLASIKDSTLPEHLSIDQIWIDAEGNAKLSDLALVSKQGANPVTKSSPEGRSIAVISSILSLVTYKIHLPGHVIELIREINERHEDISTLNWIRNQLQQSERRPASWGWDDRLGTLATSMSTENSVSYISVFTLSLILHYGLNFPTIPMIGVLILFLTALSFSFGFWFRGGPVFHFCGIELRLRDQNVASPLVCGVRNAVAWLPANSLLSTSAAILSILIMQQSDFTTQTADQFTMLAANMFMLLTLFVLGTGLIQALLVPTRSIPDYLLGTFITRK